jgi:hypothetical protein
LREDNFLSLKADVFWPFDKACEISLGLNVLAWNRASVVQMERVRKLLPMEKFLGRASNSGFFAVFAGLLAPKGAAAGFFPVPFLTGGWSLRRGHQSSVTVRTVDNA